MKKVVVESETDADGVLIGRRYEEGVLVATWRVQTLASGKRVTQTFDGSGVLREERHDYALAIMLTINFGDQGKSETYICNQRVASRAKYEQVRRDYPDMPPADPTLVDHGAELLRLVRQEQKRQAAKAHRPDAQRAQEADDFCLKLKSGPDVADAYEWFEKSNRTLGEMNRSASKRLLTKLKSHGCPGVWACEIERSDEGEQNSGNLVIELPADPAQRSAVLKMAGRIAQRQGFDPVLEDGQRFLYLKLD